MITSIVVIIAAIVVILCGLVWIGAMLWIYFSIDRAYEALHQQRLAVISRYMSGPL